MNLHGRIVRHLSRLLRVDRGDSGMSTVEYALGTLAAAAFALGLMKILTSHGVTDLLTGVIERALTKPF
jgi:spore maturation protein SpmA